MIINVDKEGHQRITALCDTILKLTGVANMAAIAHTLGNMKLIEEKDETSKTEE